MVQSRSAGLRFLRWKQGFEPLPLRVCQFFSFHIDECTPWVRVCKQALVRRAKLGSVSRRQIPAPEALARHRVPSVASQSVTAAAKRTQGGDGPQCVSVKGLSPVMRMKLWVPTCLVSRSGWGHQSDVRTEPRGKPSGPVPETASNVVPASAGTTG
jgi:hypothetical protein